MGTATRTSMAATTSGGRPPESEDAGLGASATAPADRELRGDVDTGKARAVLWLCLSAGFITLLDQSVFILAVPAMASDLEAGAAEVQWILASYSLAFGIALVPSGRLGDLLGRRALFVTGILVFGVFSLVGGLTSAPWLVIVARLLQGLGAGCLNPQVLGLLQDRFTGAERAKALGYYAAAGGSAAVCGPLIGGVILSAAGPNTGWRLLFLANVPLVLVLVPLAIKLLPKGKAAESQPVETTRRRTSVDALGALLLGAVVTTFLVPTVYGTQGASALWLAAGPASILCFAAWEFLYHRRGRTPLLSPELVRSKGYLLGTVVALCQFGVGAAMAALTAFYFLSGTGLAPLAAAAILAPQAAGMLLASSLSWRFLGRFGRAGVVLALAASLATLIAKDLAVQGLDDAAAAVVVAAVGLVQGVTTGLVVAPNQALTLGHAPTGAAGVAAGFYQLSQRFSAALCSAAIAGLFLNALPDTGFRAAFRDGIILCMALTAAAILAGAVDWLRVAAAKRSAPIVSNLPSSNRTKEIQ
ncbi:MFS transporter [Pseudarthrobacter sp. LT1]|uniref:MFS transporter n=1 Tax=Pseudarthrobacter sp. LT1 TaxID=3111450 RepID=UPI002D77BB0D|nr:MFS transporter [Pseudarthrobacter sp. LT1]WRT15750.1 MFS transporter [Pseudarthrobacter sp. LT1]